MIKSLIMIENFISIVAQFVDTKIGDETELDIQLLAEESDEYPLDTDGYYCCIDTFRQ